MTKKNTSSLEITESNSTMTKLDLHQAVTNQIISSMERAQKCEIPWKAGASSTPMSIASEKAYKGINILVLWSVAQEMNYASGVWGTYKQWAAKGGQVRKGEKSTRVVFYKTYEKEKVNGEKEARFAASTFRVFNASQVEGIAPEELPCLAIVRPDIEEFAKRTGAEIQTDEGSAYYNPLRDFIGMPAQERFFGDGCEDATESYYSTLLHELVHWTGHKDRCDRDTQKRFGDKGYAMEELVAELGAAFLCAELGISSEPRKDHASYLASWLQVLKSDPKAIFTAASAASKAVGYLTSLQEDCRAAA